jgi:hypothetical protein
MFIRLDAAGKINLRAPRRRATASRCSRSDDLGRKIRGVVRKRLKIDSKEEGTVPLRLNGCQRFFVAGGERGPRARHPAVRHPEGPPARHHHDLDRARPLLGLPAPGPAGRHSSSTTTRTRKNSATRSALHDSLPKNMKVPLVAHNRYQTAFRNRSDFSTSSPARAPRTTRSAARRRSTSCTRPSAASTPTRTVSTRSPRPSPRKTRTGSTSSSPPRTASTPGTTCGRPRSAPRSPEGDLHRLVAKRGVLLRATSRNTRSTGSPRRSSPAPSASGCRRSRSTTTSTSAPGRSRGTAGTSPSRRRATSSSCGRNTRRPRTTPSWWPARSSSPASASRTA